MRLLIVKTSSMGDVVHALPAVSDIQRAHAAAGSGGGVKALEVDWLVEPAFAAIPGDVCAARPAASTPAPAQ